MPLMIETASGARVQVTPQGRHPQGCPPTAASLPRPNLPNADRGRP